jgi:hypothetical protein
MNTPIFLKDILRSESYIAIGVGFEVFSISQALKTYDEWGGVVGLRCKQVDRSLVEGVNRWTGHLLKHESRN